MSVNPNKRNRSITNSNANKRIKIQDEDPLNIILNYCNHKRTLLYNEEMSHIEICLSSIKRESTPKALDSIFHALYYALSRNKLKIVQLIYRSMNRNWLDQITGGYLNESLYSFFSQWIDKIMKHIVVQPKKPFLEVILFCIQYFEKNGATQECLMKSFLRTIFNTGNHSLIQLVFHTIIHPVRKNIWLFDRWLISEIYYQNKADLYQYDISDFDGITHSRIHFSFAVEGVIQGKHCDILKQLIQYYDQHKDGSLRPFFSNRREDFIRFFIAYADCLDENVPVLQTILDHPTTIFDQKACMEIFVACIKSQTYALFDCLLEYYLKQLPSGFLFLKYIIEDYELYCPMIYMNMIHYVFHVKQVAINTTELALYIFNTQGLNSVSLTALNYLNAETQSHVYKNYMTAFGPMHPASYHHYMIVQWMNLIDEIKEAVRISKTNSFDTGDIITLKQYLCSYQQTQDRHRNEIIQYIQIKDIANLVVQYLLDFDLMTNVF